MFNEVIGLIDDDSLSVESLKAIAESIKAGKVTLDDELPKLDLSKIKSILNDIEEYMLAAAKEGSMEFTYAFEDEPRELMKAVANELRVMHPKDFSIIEDGGGNNLILNWSGKND